MHFVFLQLASVVKYRGSLSGGVNICVSVGGMPDGKEVAGGRRLVDGSSDNRLYNWPPPSSVAAAAGS